MFPDFFERYGGVYGVNIKDRLAEIGPRSKAPWAAFLDYIGGSESPYFRYLLHIDASVDIPFQRIALTAGQGVAFTYSFNRYQAELAMILTDCSAFQFFQMYDRFGPGFAAEGNWANQAMPETALSRGGLREPHSLCARPRIWWHCGRDLWPAGPPSGRDTSRSPGGRSHAQGRDDLHGGSALSATVRREMAPDISRRVSTTSPATSGKRSMSFARHPMEPCPR